MKEFETFLANIDKRTLFKVKETESVFLMTYIKNIPHDTEDDEPFDYYLKEAVGSKIGQGRLGDLNSSMN